MKRHSTIFLLGFLALLIIPILVTQLTKPEPRSFEWVELKDTTYQEISFRNSAQDLELAGMLFVPEGEGPFPAAVIIHGAGTSHRENGWYLTLTQYLQEHGIVVLLPDKRGSEKSEGHWRTASLEDFATDTVAALEFLSDQSEVDISDIGVIGLSQGGHIAPVVADQMQDLAFVVNIVGGAVPMHDLLVYEETHNLREMGILPGLSVLLAYPSSGENDTNVPSSESAAILRSLGNPNIDVRIYEGSGHALESPEGEGESIFREDALRDIRDFILSMTSNA